MCLPFLLAWFMISGFMLFFLALFFWLWMLADMLERKMEDKIAWTLVILFLNIIGAIMYYLMVYSRPKKTTRRKK